MSRRLKLEQRLLASAERFEFFQALRLLECAHPELPRIGSSARPAQDAVRFAQLPDMLFDGGQIERFERREAGLPPRLLVNFIGVFGPEGPLPLHVTEYARDRLRNAADPTLARFVDMFQHRLVSLFYRAWASAQPVVSFDRADGDRFGELVASLFGLGSPAMRGRDAVPDIAKLHFAGRLIAHVRNPEGLAAILSHFLGFEVRIQEFVAGWLPLDREIRSRIGGSEAVGNALGVSMVLGERVWDAQHRFRIVVGPLSLVDFRRLLPGTDGLRRLTAWVRNYVGDSFAWDLRLILRRDQVPPLQLGAGAMLGWTTWSGHQPEHGDRQELLVKPLP